MIQPMQIALAVALLAGVPAAFAQQIQPVQEQAVQTDPVQTQNTAVQARERQSSDQQNVQLSARDRVIAQMWGLSDDEMLRAKLLMLGPRGSFSVANLSPVEALGIHARSDAERRKYAELFAKAQYEDVQRVLAFQRAYDAAIAQLAAGQPVVSAQGLSKVDATFGAAEFAHIPRSQLINGGQTESKEAAQP